jgi:dTDP-L-rhamnose 4-epimerase
MKRDRSGSLVLITGGAGFIGSHTAEALLKSGYRVRLLDSLNPQIHPGGEAPAYLPRGAEFQRGSVCNESDVAKALDGVSYVFHFAAETGVGQSMHELERYFHTNVTGTAVVWQEIQRHGDQIRKFVLSSSRAVYGEGLYECVSCGFVTPSARDEARLQTRLWTQSCPQCGRDITSLPTPETAAPSCTSVYALTKLMQEQVSTLIAAQTGVRLAILRYFNVYGPRQALTNPYTGIVAGFSTRILNGKDIPLYEEGTPTRDFVHVDDVVQANLRALESDTEEPLIANIGTGRASSIRDIAESLRRALDADVPITSTTRYRRGDIFSCIADLGRARAQLGYMPTVSLDAGLRALAPWLREQNPVDRSEDVEAELRTVGVLRG